MSTYVVGDIQGCHGALLALLSKVGFDASRDRLWCVGDLVNRGPSSLETVRYLMGLGDAVTAVLGNHDLHFLAVAHGVRPARRKDTFDEMLAAEDRDGMVEWLAARPLMHVDAGARVAMVHAGLLPSWTIDEALGYAREVEAALRGPERRAFLSNMYGHEPVRLDDAIRGTSRLRVITNVLTRLRYLTRDGAIELDTKCHPDDAPAGLVPWFDVDGARWRSTRILFGHWASLNGEVDRGDVCALDTGCVWNRDLTALCLETGRRFSCGC